MATLFDSFLQKLKTTTNQVGNFVNSLQPKKVPLLPVATTPAKTPVSINLKTFQPTYQQATKVASKIPVPPPPKVVAPAPAKINPPKVALDLKRSTPISSAQPKKISLAPPSPTINKIDQAVRGTDQALRGIISLPGNIVKNVKAGPIPDLVKGNIKGAANKIKQNYQESYYPGELPGDVTTTEKGLYGQDVKRNLTADERTKNLVLSVGIDASGVKPKKTSKVPNPEDPFYNVNRIGVLDKDKQFVKDVMESPEMKKKVEGVVGKKMSFQEVKDLAKVSPELKSTKARVDTLETGASALALRNKVADLAKLGLNNEQFQEALIQDKAFGNFLGRLLGQRRIVSNPAEKTLFNEVISKIIKEGHDPATVAKAAKGVDFTNPQETTKFFRKFIKPDVGDWVDKIRYNSMLTSPITHIVNLTSNFEGTGVLAPVQKTLEGTIDSIVSGVTGRPRTRFAGEGAAYAKGYYSALGEATKKVIDVFKGKQLSENPDIRQIPLTTGGKARIAENVLDVATRSLEAVDQFFKTVTESGLRNQYQYRLGKGGTKLSQDVSEEANKFLFRNELTKKGEGVISNAIGAGGKWVKAGTESDNKTVRWLAKLTLPFINIGTNLAKTGAEANPVIGPFNYIGNEDKIAQTAKLAMGSVISTLAVPLALNGQLTFNEPADPTGRTNFRNAGMLPYSIKIGDKWYQYSKQHPLVAFQLATTAAVIDALKNGKFGETTAEHLMSGFVNTLRFISDQTYFKNVGDFVNSLSGGAQEDLSRLPSNYLSQGIPFRALSSWINNMIDEYQRKPDTKADFFTKSFQNIAAQLPYFSQFVPTRNGPDDNPLQKPDRFINAFSPVRVSTENKKGKGYLDLFTQTSKLKSDQIKAAEERATRGQQLYEEWKNLSPNEANIKLDQLQEIDPDLAAAVERAAKKANLTPEDERIQMLGVKNGDRAKVIWQQSQKLNSSKEKNDYINNLRDKGIITDTVFEQLKQLKTEQPEKQSSLLDSLNPKTAGQSAANATKKIIAAVPEQSKQAAAEEIPVVIQALKDEGIATPNVIAYALATIEHETAGTFRPIEEYSGRDQARKLGYGGGENYFGRGFIQLTHKDNYEQIGRRIGVPDLAEHPEKALDPQIAAKILAAFFKDRGVAELAESGNFYRARNPVNGTDQANQIAQLANKYRQSL